MMYGNHYQTAFAGHQENQTKLICPSLLHH